MAFLDTLEQKLQNLVSLRITTQVDGTTPRIIETTIDLFQGDLKTLMHQDFVLGELQPLREFHSAQVAKAETIVANNIEAIVKLAKDLSKR